MVYQRDLDHYRYTARGRYRRLLDRCPQVVQMLSLKDIASFLRSAKGRFARQRTSPRKCFPNSAGRLPSGNKKLQIRDFRTFNALIM